MMRALLSIVHTVVCVIVCVTVCTYLDFENPDLAQRQKRAEMAGGQQQLILQLYTNRESVIGSSHVHLLILCSTYR